MPVLSFIVAASSVAQQSGGLFDTVPPWIWLMLVAVIVVQGIAAIRRRRKK